MKKINEYHAVTSVNNVCIRNGVFYVKEIPYELLILRILAYSALKYPLKCAPAETAAAHISGYFNNY